MDTGFKISATVSFGHFQVLPHRRELLSGGRRVQIGGRAFDLLIALLEARGAVVSKEELIGRVWPDRIVEENNLQIQVSALRAVLGADRDLVRTVPGRGYHFAGEIGLDPDADERRGLAAVDRQAESAPNNVSEPFDHNDELPDTQSAVATPGPATPTEPYGAAKAQHKSRRGNVPASWVELVGQAGAVQQVEELVSAHRVVTLTGPGGIGKTTLALEVARRLIDSFEGESWFVELAPLSNAALVPSAVARVLGFRLSGEEIASEAVARAIGERRLLLVLDNCEHVIEPIADLIATVVRSCPNVSILATSREFLMVEGEYIYRVQPLEVPPEHPGGHGDILQHSAVQLLVTRTKAQNSDFVPQHTQFASLVAISRRLEGIPLAIEFAAARVAALGLDRVAARLDDRLGLLTTAGRRTAAPRHQTLRATLDWSYELLSDFEQRLLRHLAVFQGGFTIDSAAAAFGTEHSSSEITENITHLLAKSLISPSGTEGRWRLLDTTRAYAIEKLDQAAEISDAKRRHAEYFCSFVVANSEKFRDTVDAIVASAGEIDNARAALDWAFSAAGDDEIGIALTAAYIPVWFHFMLLGECRGWIEHALKCPAASIDLNSRYRMQLIAGHASAILLSRGPSPEASAAWANVLEIAETLADAGYQLRALWGLFAEQITQGACQTAFRTAERFSEIAKSTDQADVLIGERMRGTALHHLGRQLDARPHIERFLANEASLTDQRPDASRFQFDQGVVARCFHARILWLQGYADRAMRVAADAVRVAQTIDKPVSLIFALFHSACPIALLATDLPAAESSVMLLLDLSIKHAMEPWRTLGRSFLGMLLCKKHSDKSQGIKMIRTALSELPENSFNLHYVHILADLADALGLSGQTEQGLVTIEQALTRCNRTKEAWCVPELMRVKGELFLQEGDSQTGAAKDHFLHAIDLAEQQGALSWQLRAAMSLARVKQPNDRGVDPRQILARVYGKFTEGFGTRDLVSARELIGHSR
jgi:predicted ATPase/DNA-binding winged helix-turn-helix (wHTH) protein